MSTERRLAKLQGALTPRAATLLWLAEAHAFPTLHAYVAWLVDQPVSAAPLYRVPETARAGVRGALRGEPRHQVDRAVREGVKEASFLVELVLRINAAAEAATGLLGLRYAALYWEMRAISAEAQLAPAGTSRRGRDTVTARWAAWRGMVASLLGHLYGIEEARLHLERRYLDGSPTLFPDLAADCQALREQAERLVGLGDEVGPTAAKVGGARRARGRSRGPLEIDLPQLRAAARDRATAEATALMDSARTAALDGLGDTNGAATIAERSLRSNAARYGLIGTRR